MRINWLNAHYYHYDGYGRFGLKFIRALSRMGVEIMPGLAAQMMEMPGWMHRMAGFDFTRLTISLMPPHCMPHTGGRHWGYTMTEAQGMPPDWAAFLNNKVERVVVPCEWLVEVMEETGVRRPVSVVHGGVDEAEFPLIERQHDPDRPYTFMALGDRGNRKGHDLAWLAFCRAFEPDDDVRMIIKRRSYGEDSPIIDNTQSPDPMSRKIAIWAEDVRSMSDVYPAADCFVFPSRGEGWGMPPREAASMGIPTIVTRWSGLEVGIDNWATRTIDNYTIGDAPYIPNALRGKWANPDVDELVAHMRWCYDNRDDAREKAKTGAQWLHKHMSWNDSAKQMHSLLERHG